MGRPWSVLRTSTLAHGGETSFSLCWQVFYGGRRQVGVPMPYPLPEGTVSLHIRYGRSWSHATTFPGTL